MFVMHSYLFIGALWSTTRKALAFWLSCVLCFCHLTIWFPGTGVWYLIISISDLLLTYYFYGPCVYTMLISVVQTHTHAKCHQYLLKNDVAIHVSFERVTSHSPQS